MKIAVLGANKKLGQKIILAAEKSKISTVSIVDSFTDVVGDGAVVIKSIDDLTYNDVKDCHYVIDPLSFFKISKYSTDNLPLWHILEILKDTDTKLLELGSSACLYTDKSKTTFVANQNEGVLNEFEDNKEELLCLNTYKRLQHCHNVKWSVLCPPLLIDDSTYGTGRFEFSNEILPVGVNGERFISETDFISATIELLKTVPELHKCTSVRGLN